MLHTVHMNENIEVAVVSVRAAEGGTSTIIPFLTSGHAFISLIGLLEKNGMDIRGFQIEDLVFQRGLNLEI